MPNSRPYSLDLPALAKDHPEQINQRLQAIFNPGYFFTADSWQTALSTGALEHMSTEEVSAYGETADSIPGLHTTANGSRDPENNTRLVLQGPSSYDRRPA